MNKETLEQYGYDDLDSDELEKQIKYWMRVKSGLKREGIECAWGRRWWTDALPRGQKSSSTALEPEQKGEDEVAERVEAMVRRQEN